MNQQQLQLAPVPTHVSFQPAGESAILTFATPVGLNGFFVDKENAKVLAHAMLEWATGIVTASPQQRMIDAMSALAKR